MPHPLCLCPQNHLHLPSHCAGDELVATELIFGGVLAELEPEEAVALLAALVFQEKSASEPELTPRLEVRLAAGRPPPPPLSCAAVRLQRSPACRRAFTCFRLCPPPVCAPPPPSPLPPRQGARDDTISLALQAGAVQHECGLQVCSHGGEEGMGGRGWVGAAACFPAISVQALSPPKLNCRSRRRSLCRARSSLGSARWVSRCACCVLCMLCACCPCLDQKLVPSMPSFTARCVSLRSLMWHAFISSTPPQPSGGARVGARHALLRHLPADRRDGGEHRAGDGAPRRDVQVSCV